MIDVNKLIISTRKKEIFANSSEENHAAIIVLGEIKTKYVDIREDITPQIQHKLLTKMSNDRSKAIEVYLNAGRADKADAEKQELNIISFLLQEVEKDLPKQMSEQEIVEKIQAILSNCNQRPNIGIIMKEFKDLPADKALVSKIAKEMINSYAS